MGVIHTRNIYRASIKIIKIGIDCTPPRRSPANVCALQPVKVCNLATVRPAPRRTCCRSRPNVPPVVRLPVPLPVLAATVRPSPSTFAPIRAVLPPVAFAPSVRLVARPNHAPRPCAPCHAPHPASSSANVRALQPVKGSNLILYHV